MNVVPFHFKHLKVWRRLRRGEEEEEKKKKPVRQRWSFIQRTGGHGTVNKGRREKKEKKKKKRIPFHLSENMTEE